MHNAEFFAKQSAKGDNIMHNSKLIDTQSFVVCRLLGTRRIASVRVSAVYRVPYGFNLRNSHFPNFGRWYQYNS